MQQGDTVKLINVDGFCSKKNKKLINQKFFVEEVKPEMREHYSFRIIQKSRIVIQKTKNSRIICETKDFIHAKMLLIEKK